MASVDLAVVRALVELRAPHVLIEAALDGWVPSMTCALDICICPEGRNFWERVGNPKYSPWSPSPDRWPVPAREGGLYLATNVRLGHVNCNKADGGRVGGSRRTAAKTAANQGKAALGLNAWLRTPEGRANSSRNITRVNATWRKSPAGRAWQEQNDPKRRAGHERWLATEKAREGMQRRGRQVTCLRWQVQRGQPCICGLHEAVA